MTRANGVLEDICGEIGYTATSLLVAWFGGANLYVPVEATNEHPVARLVGQTAFKRLVAAYGGDWVSISSGHMEAIDHRNRLIAERLSRGDTVRDIAAEFGLSERRVQQLRADIEHTGLTPRGRRPISVSSKTKEL